MPGCPAEATRDASAPAARRGVAAALTEVGPHATGARGPSPEPYRFAPKLAARADCTGSVESQLHCVSPSAVIGTKPPHKA